MKIKSVKKGNKKYTVDITVKDTHSYQLENGCVVHNTASIVLGTSSGIHAWHNDYYIRRIRVGKNEAIYRYLNDNYPELIEDDVFRSHDTAIIAIPQKSPDGAILRTETALELLNRIKQLNVSWIKPGHLSGANSHNISATVSIKDNEWDVVGEWLWKNRNYYNGLSILPYTDHTYVQPPFEDITKEQYEDLFSVLKTVNLDNIIEEEDYTELKAELACSGNACEIF
jgi:ribonucleoside-diphosphate reductase alpha chain